MKITLTNILLQEIPSGNQTIHLAWKIEGQPDSSYTPLPDATVDPTGLIIFPFPYEFLTGTITEDIRVRAINDCNAGYVITALFDGLNPPIWIEDTYICEQDNPVTLVNTYNGFSSPLYIMWDATTSRFYVIDSDNVNGNVWWFDPTVMSGPADQNFVPGSVVPGGQIQAADVSESLRKVFMAGPSTGGAIIYDIGSGSFVSVGGGTDSSFARLVCKLVGNTLYLSNQVDATLALIDATNDTLISTVAVASIPGNASNQYFNSAYTLHSVNGEVWVCAGAARNINGHIARYNSTLTAFLGQITIPGVAIAFGGGYWQWTFHDVAMGRFYLHDAGSNTTSIINTGTLAIDQQIVANDLQGKSNSQIIWELNSLTGQLYASRFNINTPGDLTPIIRFYVVNRTPTTYQYETMYTNQSVAGLKLRVGTNEFWSVFSGVFVWNIPNTGWDTDGRLFRYTS